MEQDIGFADPEYVLVEEIRHPLVEQTGAQHDRDDVEVRESAAKARLEYAPDGNFELEPNDVLENVSLPERRVREETPVLPTRRSQRETAGKHNNPFHLPKAVCTTVSLSPPGCSQVLAGMAHSSQSVEENEDED